MLRQLYPELEKRTTEIAALTLLVVIGSASAASQTGITGSSTDGNLVAEYRFDTGAGDTAYDTANNNDGTVNGASWTSGVEGRALKFDGSDDYIRINGYKGVTGTNPRTTSFWFKSSVNKNHGLVRWGTNNQGEKYTIRVHNGDHLRIENSGGQKYDTEYDITDGRWHHLAVVFPSGGDSVQDHRLYIDGNLATNTGGGDQSLNTASDADVHIGDPAWHQEYANGKMDNIRIYSESLNHSQVRSLYNSGSWTVGSSGETGLPSKVLDMDFQHVQNGQVLDTSGNNNHGTIEGGAEQAGATECKVGSCFKFDGGSDGLALSDSSSLSTGFNYTISTWVYADSEGKGTERRIIQDGLARDGLIQIWDGNSMFFYQRVAGDLYAVSHSWNYPHEEWHHIAHRVEYNSETNETTLYSFLDGKLKSSRTATGKPDPYSGTMNIGESNFDGKIDQMKVFDRALTDQEIWKIYSKGRDRSSNAVPGAAARFGFDSSPRVCILNQDGGLSDGGWGGPSDSQLKDLLDSEGWNTKYVQVGDITEDGWRSCDVIVFPNSERYPAFDKSADFCSSVNGEGSEHDVYMEMKEFMRAGGMWVGTWGAGMWYGQAWDGSSWNSYTGCSQYSGDDLYKDGGGARCSDIGYSCYSNGNYDYSNINQSAAPALPNTITGASKNNRWASNLDVNVIQAYNASSGYLIANKYVGIEKVGDGYYFHPGGSHVFDPGNYGGADDAWNNLLTWYAGGGEQRFWDSAESNAGTINGDGNAPRYVNGKRGSAMKFDGVDDNINIPSSAGISGMDRFTISAWVETGAWENFICKPGEYHIRFRTNPNDFDFYTNFESAGGVSLTTSDGVSDNTWHHVTLTYDGQDLIAYVDGSKEASQSVSNDQLSSSSNDLNLGKHCGGDHYFPNKLDDVRIYPYALSQDQISRVMNNGGVSVNG